MTAPYVHPKLQHILDDAPPRPLLSYETLSEIRETGLVIDPESFFPKALPPNCHKIDGPAGLVEVYEFRPSHDPKSEAALLWMHGGGYVAGHGNDPWFGALFAERAGVRVFSVHYRLAPEHPFPAALDDSWAALNWLATQSETLEIDLARLAIGGASAGGGLAAGLAIHNRDQKGPSLAFQLLLYPMLDHLHDNPAGHVDVPRWPRANSMQAWEMYLGGSAPKPSSVAAIATDLSGLPPAFLTIGEADLFLDDVRTYAMRLADSGVALDLKSYPGVFHAAEMQGYGTSIGRQMTDDYVKALAVALGKNGNGV